MRVHYFGPLCIYSERSANVLRSGERLQL